MVGDHAAEQIGRDAADKSCRRAETRHADGDVEAGTADHRNDRVAPVHRLDGQEIDQGISAAQQHRLASFRVQPQRSSSSPRIASRLSRSSFRINPWTRRFADGSRPSRARSVRSTSRSPTSRSSPRRSIRKSCRATAPSMAAPSSTGSCVSGTRDGQARRIRHDLADQRTPSRAAADHHQVAVDTVRSKGIDDIGKAVGEPAKSRHEQPFHRADVGVEIETRDDRARIGIGERRAVAEKLGQDVDVAGKQRRLAQDLPRARGCAAREIPEFPCRRCAPSRRPRHRPGET